MAYGNPGSTRRACNRPSGYVSDCTDCNDNCESCHPGGTEVCDGRDNDCDGAVDPGTLCHGDFDRDGDVDLADAMVMAEAHSGPGVPTDNALADFDGDGDSDLADWVFFLTLYADWK